MRVSRSTKFEKIVVYWISGPVYRKLVEIIDCALNYLNANENAVYCSVHNAMLRFLF